MVLSAHRGFHCQHRSDDFPTIAAIIERHRPTTVIELGTDEGGFAAWLADLVASWGGHVTTFDRDKKFDPELLSSTANLTFIQDDVLMLNWKVSALAARTGALLYCDNGNKKREMQLYAPDLKPGSMLGVHDYDTEVSAEWCEAFMQEHGFEPEGHDEMEKLRNEWYEPMTRFWVRR